MNFKDLIAKTKKRISAWMRPTKNGRSVIRDMRVISLLIVIVFALITISIVFGSNGDGFNFPTLNRNRTNQDFNVRGIEPGEVLPTYRKPNWEIEFPENYSIKENDSFITEEFGVFYERGEDRYYVNIYSGIEFSYDELKDYILVEVLYKSEDLKDYTGKIPNSLITFNDYRGQPPGNE